MKSILLGSLLVISCCACVGPIYALASAEENGLSLASFDWNAIGILFVVSAVCLALFLALGRVLQNMSSFAREMRRPETNSEMRKRYYPEYVNRQEAKRREAAERAAHNDNAYAAAFWAGSNDYIDYDGNSRRVKGIMDNHYPEGSFRVDDDQIIARGVTRGKSKPKHTPMKITRR